jgi:hypothetical protein
MRLVALSVALLGLSACATVPIASNEAGGIIRVRGTFNQQSGGMKMAEAECRKFARIARYESINDMHGTLRYTCVKP